MRMLTWLGTLYEVVYLAGGGGPSEEDVYLAEESVIRMCTWLRIYAEGVYLAEDPLMRMATLLSTLC
jgi:hypothetical protein